MKWSLFLNIKPQEWKDGWWNIWTNIFSTQILFEQTSSNIKMQRPVKRKGKERERERKRKENKGKQPLQLGIEISVAQAQNWSSRVGPWSGRKKTMVLGWDSGSTKGEKGERKGRETGGQVGGYAKCKLSSWMWKSVVGHVPRPLLHQITRWALNLNASLAFLLSLPPSLSLSLSLRRHGSDTTRPWSPHPNRYPMNIEHTIIFPLGDLNLKWVLVGFTCRVLGWAVLNSMKQGTCLFLGTFFQLGIDSMVLKMSGSWELNAFVRCWFVEFCDCCVPVLAIGCHLQPVLHFPELVC